MDIGTLTPFDLLLVALSTWGVAYGIVSGTEKGSIVNNDEIADFGKNNKPDADGNWPTPPEPIFANSYYGETDGKLGPFGLYKSIRKWLGTSNSEVLNQASSCRICVSLGIAIAFSWLAAVNFMLSEIALFGFAAHGAIVVYVNWVRIKTYFPESNLDGWLANDF